MLPAWTGSGDLFGRHFSKNTSKRDNVTGRGPCGKSGFCKIILAKEAPKPQNSLCEQPVDQIHPSGRLLPLEQSPGIVSAQTHGDSIKLLKNMRKLFIACLLLRGIAFAALPDQVQFIDSATLQAKGVLAKKHSFLIELQLAKYRPDQANEMKFYGGDRADYRPDVIIQSLDLRINGEKIAIPSEALEDLGDPNWSVPTLGMEGDKVYLMISGGNAGWSDYVAKMEIINGQVTKRTVINYMMESTSNEPPDVKEFPSTVKQVGAGQPAARPGPKPEGGGKSQPEAERRSRQRMSGPRSSIRKS